MRRYNAEERENSLLRSACVVVNFLFYIVIIIWYRVVINVVTDSISSYLKDIYM